MSMYLIETVYAKGRRWRGGKRPVVGHRKAQAVGEPMSSSTWHQKMFGRKWFIMMAWNWAACLEEMSTSTARSRLIYNRRLQKRL